MNFQIPPEDRLAMIQAYDDEFPDEDNEDEELEAIRNLYIVTHDYLKLKHIDLCKILRLQERFMEF